jgi:flagellar assembly protein FliH
MTSTSSEPVVLRDLPNDAVASAGTAQDLRGGRWTRLGGTAVRGDEATEGALQRLAERSRDAGRAQGYAAGWAEGRTVALAQAELAERDRAAGREAAHAQVLAAQQCAVDALAKAAEHYAGASTDLLEALADQAFDLALRIAEAVIGRELETAADPGGDALRRALTLVPPAAAVTVRLHPEDRALLDLTVLAGRPVSLVDDPALTRGDAVVETETGVVDATVGAALDRVREVLGR